MKSSFKGRILIIQTDELSQRIYNQLKEISSDYNIQINHEIKDYLATNDKRYLNDLFSLEDFYPNQYVLWFVKHRTKYSEDEKLNEVLRELSFEDTNTELLFYQLPDINKVNEFAELILETLEKDKTLFMLGEALEYKYGRILYEVSTKVP